MPFSILKHRAALSVRTSEWVLDNVKYLGFGLRGKKLKVLYFNSKEIPGFTRKLQTI